jgi:AcrR family transcriptional regulator
MATADQPRRMSREARRDQLSKHAVAAVARAGVDGPLMDLVGEQAGVTRNLLYHYFPRGRQDLVLAAADEAGRALAEGWVVDEAIPLDQRLQANFARMLEHALAPSDAWLTYQHTRTSGDPEVRAVTDSHVDAVVANVARNHLGTPDPPPLVRAALIGFVSFAEAVLDEVRTQGLPREAVYAVLRRTLVAAVATAREHTPGER